MKSYETKGRLPNFCNGNGLLILTVNVKYSTGLVSNALIKWIFKLLSKKQHIFFNENLDLMKHFARAGLAYPWNGSPSKPRKVDKLRGGFLV